MYVYKTTNNPPESQVRMVVATAEGGTAVAELLRAMPGMIEAALAGDDGDHGDEAAHDGKPLTTENGR